MKAGQTPGYPRFQGANRYTSFTYKQFGNGSYRWIMASWSSSKIGRLAVRWSRPMEGTTQDRHDQPRS